MTSGSKATATPRDLLLQRLTEDLVGPGQEGDGVAERPSDRYLTAILFPKGAQLPDDENEGDLGAAGNDDDDADDSPAPITGGLRPSTCGLSFALSPEDRPSIKIEVSCARYTRFFVDPETGKPSTDDGHARRENARWRRHPLKSVLTKELQITDDPDVVDLTAHGTEGLELYLRASRGPNCTIATAALINRLEDPRDDRVVAEERTFFQVEMRISAVVPARLVARPAKNPGDDRDARVSALIYRDVREMAVGHTCSAAWGPIDSEVEWIETQWLPTAVVRRMRPEGDPAFDILREHPTLKPLSAKWLAETATDADLVDALNLLVKAYDGWLDKQEVRIPTLANDLQHFARENLTDCRTAAVRMKAAVHLLATNPVVRTAWRLAAGAMNLQFGWSGRGELRWHPFQIGFQLLVLTSLVNPESDERSTMDLLWFPTGGGKTEAYLALTAILLFFRRLHHPGLKGCGTAVLMRYTLRLLTVQQFQRAAALIAACEAIRRGHEHVTGAPTPNLGDVPFSIGLWVGGSATPNNFKAAVKALRDDGAASTPRQLPRCPKCRARLDYRPDNVREAIDAVCTGADCYFSDRTRPIPIWAVDTDIYRERPSLLIATLDKFAQIVRKPETSALFGLDDQAAPPDLIIQDELHLISGPLGSLAGLYEVAIDRLCSRQIGDRLIPPKIIGSTATIRRAADQVEKLFARGAFQFPPPVIDATNSGFGIEDRQNPGRLYVGLSTAGRSAKFALQATYASLLQAATDAQIPSAPPLSNSRDRHWTLTGYFNSLRELGGAVTLTMDDVVKSIRGYARRRGETPRRLTPPVELTSRVPSSEIPSILERLEQPIGDPNCVDVLLASNMISVGVDVRRLGLMVVAAQPKTVAEYIQATSRVGRHEPGLVVVVYNHPRVRDRSFFETFPTWHRALYRAVEATSVTPFASRARDRAMHAVVVALARYLADGLMLTPGSIASQMARVRELIDLIVARVHEVDTEEEAGSRRCAEDFLADWERLVDEGTTEYWHHKDFQRSLLVSAEDFAALEEHGEHVQAWPTPNSMREVEPSALFRLWSRPAGPRARRRAAHADE